MRIPVAEQRRLLDLQQVDQNLARARHDLDHLASTREAADLAARRKTANLNSVRLRMEGEDFGRQAKRVDEDLERVRARRARNAEMASSGVDARVQRELQHESESLDRRQRELEDAEIGFLERQEESLAKAAKLAEEAEVLSQQVEQAQGRAESERSGLAARIQDQRRERVEIVKSLSPELVAKYDDNRARRGVGVAVLEAGQCSACRIALAPDELDRLQSAHEDEVTSCEECGSLLLR